MKISAELFGRFQSHVLRFGCTALLCATVANVPARADCSATALMGLKVPNVTVASAALVPAAAPNPEYCDVKGSVITSGDGADPGSANFEIMLPPTGIKNLSSTESADWRALLPLRPIPPTRPCFWREAMPPQLRTPVT